MKLLYVCVSHLCMCSRRKVVQGRSRKGVYLKLNKTKYTKLHNSHYKTSNNINNTTMTHIVPSSVCSHTQKCLMEEVLRNSSNGVHSMFSTESSRGLQCVHHHHGHLGKFSLSVFGWMCVFPSFPSRLLHN